MSTRITLIANEGFRIATEAAVLYVDAFHGLMPSALAVPTIPAGGFATGDLILVTHAHWDHFSARDVARMASKTGAAVAGPRDVVRALCGVVAPEALVELEPHRTGRTGEVTSVRADLPAAAVTAYRTFHGGAHNSYLVETSDFRFFHDGDNEDTRRLDPAALGRLDALFIAPWQGSGWVDFIERLSPARWFLMHMSDEELAAHNASRFFPDLCDHIPLPDRLVVLRPGESLECE